MAESIINVPITPIWGANGIARTKINTAYYVDMLSSSAAKIGTNIPPNEFVSAIPYGVFDSNGSLVSRDLQFDIQVSVNQSQVVLIAKKQDGTLWTNALISYRVIYFS